MTMKPALSTAERLELAMSATADAVVWTDETGRVQWCNDRFAALTGFSREGARQRRVESLLPLRPAEGPAPTEHPAVAVVRDHRPVSGRYHVTQRGKTTCWDFLGQWIALEDGGMALFTLRDVTARQSVDDDLRERSQELQRSNAQLEQFASAASHDLLEPLRKILAFGELLSKNSAASLDQRGKDFLSRIHNAASRMTVLVEDLLQYSRVMGDTRPFERVDLNEVARQVAHDLDARAAGVGASIHIGALPVINAHPFQMRQLFQNLIGNALKFRAPSAAPSVSIEARPARAGFVEFGVRDNGIGFEQKDAEKIFEPFVRLHTRTEYEGSGIGLAICRRIMLRHGGWISAQSQPGQGALFIVTFPSGDAP